ncbi:hypothetical protein AJ78_04661 [Emergomyces pasteurianus Ep9510]|uniref:Uncharacterized protein n=1 Tax=Emergomyces pasteurianus Ep9510 TaxID=1447872 RepID=A0A1J9PGD2_9EURO|nr:hypothetical protein AJ78_04661 [Emergomyces pasteurianus Ep9510]
MPPAELDDDYDVYKYPEFYLPVIPETTVILNLPTPLIPEFRHKDQEYKLLNHLWHIQLGQDQVRHHWNVQALHNFWRTCGPSTFEGRHYGWSPTWIVDALDSLKNDLELLQKVADRATLKRRRMSVQARQVLQGAGIRVKDKESINEEEVKLAFKLAKEDVGDEGCAGDEEVQIKKHLKDKDGERDREAETVRSRWLRVSERAERTNRVAVALRGSEANASDGSVIDESPTRKPPRARERHIALPSSFAVDDLETKQEVRMAYCQQGYEQKGDRERQHGFIDFHSPLISPFSKRKTTKSPLPVDVVIRVSECGVDSGSESELEQSRNRALLGRGGAELASFNNEECTYPGEGCFNLTPPTSENRK